MEGEGGHGNQSGRLDYEPEDVGYSAEAEGILESMERAMKFWDRSSGKSVLTLDEIRRCETSVISEEFIGKILKYEWQELNKLYQKLKMTGSISKRIVKDKAKEMLRNVLKPQVNLEDFLATIDEDKDTAIEMLGQEFLQVFDNVCSRSVKEPAAKSTCPAESSGVQPNTLTPNSEIAELLEQAHSLGMRTSYFSLENFATERSIVASLRRQIQGKIKRRELLNMAGKEGSARVTMKVMRNNQESTCDSETFHKRMLLIKEKAIKNNEKKKKISNLPLLPSPPSPSKRVISPNRLTIKQTTPLSGKDLRKTCRKKDFILKLHAINPQSESELVSVKHCAASIDILKNKRGQRLTEDTTNKKGELKRNIYKALYHSSDSNDMKEVPLVCCDSGNIIGISLVDEPSESFNTLNDQVSDRKICVDPRMVVKDGTVLVNTDVDTSKNLINSTPFSKGQKGQKTHELETLNDCSSMSLLRNKEKKVTWVDVQADSSDAWLVDEQQMQNFEERDSTYHCSLLLNRKFENPNTEVKLPQQRPGNIKSFQMKLRRSWSPAVAFGSIIALFICVGALTLTKTGFVEASISSNEHISTWLEERGMIG